MTIHSQIADNKISRQLKIPQQRITEQSPAYTIQTDHPSLSRLPVTQRYQFSQFGSGETVTPDFPLIHQGFEYFAATQPHACAIREASGRQISYQDLNNQANTLAVHLQNNQIGRGDSVCIYMRRSLEMVVGILATLKLGANYVPQDMQLCPDEQRNHILSTVAAKVVLTTRQYQQKICNDESTTIAVDTFLEQANVINIQPQLLKAIQPDDTAVIIFTSGTTGKANGVQVTHANLANILLTAPGNLGINPGDKVAQLLNIAFDMATWEILGCLSNGGTLLIRDKDFQATAEQADILIATPSILARLDANRCQRVKAVAVAGEPCPQPLANVWSSFCKFYNSCGPTETTIINTAAPYQPDDPILSIGKPTPNNTVYILDEQLQPCAIGESGEMWAGGVCVSKGYINNPTLTSERYKDDPFLGKGHKMFRTRDLGRWTEEGTLEHLGRVDDQVKICGFRIELDAVSAVLERTEHCNHAVTLKLDNRHLAAFVSPANVDIQAARKHLQQALPYYCEPLFILPVKELPTTIRGKVDKHSLLKIAQEYYLNITNSGAKV